MYNIATLHFLKIPCIQARFPDSHRLLFPVKCSEVREVGVAEAKLDTSVVLSHGIWTGMLLRPEVILCIVCREKFSLFRGKLVQLVPAAYEIW